MPSVGLVLFVLSTDDAAGGGGATGHHRIASHLDVVDEVERPRGADVDDLVHDAVDHLVGRGWQEGVAGHER